jgi:hypothetical protein
LFFEETINAANFPNLYTQFVALLEGNKLHHWFQQHVGKHILRKEHKLFSWISSLTALSGVVFGHHDPQTLHHLTSFCGDFLKKESTAITQEPWRTLNTTLSKLLLFIVTMEMQQCVPSALLRSYKIFCTAINNRRYHIL